MKSATKNKLAEAQAFCNKQNKSTEFMIQYMQDSCKVSFECVVKFLTSHSDAAGLGAIEMADAQRISKLQNLGYKNRLGWICRNSTSGRGIRLHQTTQEGASPDIRTAIDKFLLEEIKEG